MAKFMAFLVILFFGLIGYFAVLNRDHITIVLWKEHLYDVSKTALVLVSSVVGAMLVFIAFIVRDTKKFIYTLQYQKKVKREDKIKSLYSKALDAYFGERWDDAKVILEQILKEDPENVNALVKLGDIVYENGDLKNSFEYYNRAHTLDSSRVEALFPLVKVKEATRSYADAIMYIDEILDVDTNNMRALHKKRELLEKMDRWGDLMHLQKSIIKKVHDEGEKAEEEKGLAGYEYEYGRASLENGELEKAQKAFRTVIKLDRGFIPAHLGLAEVMLREENMEGAINYLETIFGETRSLIILARLEDLLISLGEPSRLIRTYKNSLAHEPDNSTLKLFLGKLYHRLEMLDDAIDILNDIDPSASYPEVSKILGNIYLKRNQHDKAATEFKKVIDMQKALRLPYCCSNCGYSSIDWSGRCPSCRRWDTYRFDIFGSCKLESPVTVS